MVRDEVVADPAHFRRRLELCDEWRQLVEGAARDGGPEWGQRIGDASSQLHRVRALYSLGAPIAEVRAANVELPDLVSRQLQVNPMTPFNPAHVGGGFNDFLWVTSLAALFDDVEGALLLAGAVGRFNMTDFLIDSFIGSLIEFREPSQSLQLETISNFHGVKPTIRSHEKLKAVAELAATDQAAASAALTTYVTREWYPQHKWAAWHNQHSSRRGAKNYSGYWCFEGAATAKVFGIDDSPLENCKYYPWDLAHP
ncbi:MAG: DUF1911 domain-containing protein [Acidimicrobiia bacterium]|nr:DUF1911 domain-containing protein [Acidimicrobiia bacterium]